MIQLGPLLKKLRKERNKTQAQVARELKHRFPELEISRPLVAMHESDKRVVSGEYLKAYAGYYKLTPEAMLKAEAARDVENVREAARFFRSEVGGVDEGEIQHLYLHYPQITRLIGTLFRQWADCKTDLQAARGESPVHPAFSAMGNAGDDEPSEEVSAVSLRHAVNDVSVFVQDQRNFFPSLERAASRLRKDLRVTSVHDLYHQLRDRLHEFGFATVVRDADSAPNTLSAFDRQAKTVSLSALLPHTSRVFELAAAVGRLTLDEEIATILSMPAAPQRNPASSLLKKALWNYFAAAVIMPYDDYLEAAERFRYDVERLQHQFSVSFELACQRLASLNDPLNRGIRFHFLRVDIAGNVSKRFSESAMDFPILHGICPLWVVHDAFLTPGVIRTQVSEMPNGKRFFCLARTVRKAAPAFRKRAAQFVIGLGCNVDDVKNTVYGDLLPELDDQRLDVVKVGWACHTCERGSCHQRAFPRSDIPLYVDENVRYRTPYSYLPEPKESTES